MKMYKYYLAVLMLLAAVGLGSCKKGCNNPRAYNYSTAAQQDDGSCLYCDSSKQTVQVNSLNIYDYNSNSPYYGSMVMSGQVMADERNYTGNGCKLLGKGTDNAGNRCITIDYYVILTNNLGRTVTYTDNVRYSYGSNSIQGTRLINVTLPAYGSATIPMTTVCNNVVFMYVQSNIPTFQYH